MAGGEDPDLEEILEFFVNGDLAHDASTQARAWPPLSINTDMLQAERLTAVDGLLCCAALLCSALHPRELLLAGSLMSAGYHTGQPEARVAGRPHATEHCLYRWS